MQTPIFLATLAVVAWVGLSSPINHNHELVIHSPARYHLRRSPVAQDAKGRRTVQHQHAQAPVVPRPESNLRKGEYVCGTGVCKLRPGEVPAGCGGMCQYRV